MNRIAGTVLVLLAVAQLAAALPPDVPEISGGSAVTALGLISGALLVFRRRRSN